MAFATIAAALFGLILGSFLNVVIHRLPRGESLITPPSRCPGCEAPVRPYDNIPVLSWLLLRGRCRNCGEPISWRYPLVELLTAVLMASVVLVKGADRDAWLGLAFVLVLVPCALIDLEHQILPNKITYPAAVLAPVIIALTRPGHLPEYLIAGAAAALFLLLAWLAYPAGMGIGDIKFAGVLGLFLGRSVAVAMLAALLTGTLVGVGIMVQKGVAAGRKTKVPFGVFLSIGGVVGLLAGPPIVQWYLDTFV